MDQNSNSPNTSRHSGSIRLSLRQVPGLKRIFSSRHKQEDTQATVVEPKPSSLRKRLRSNKALDLSLKNGTAVPTAYHQDALKELKDGREAEVGSLKQQLDEARRAHEEDNLASEALSTRLSKENSQLRSTVAALESKLLKAHNAPRQVVVERVRDESREQEWTKSKTKYEDDITKLNDQLQELQSRHATLRTAVQVRETREPGEIAKAFVDLNTMIRNVCFSLSNSIVDRFDDPNRNTSLDVVDLAHLIELVPSAGSLIQSPSGAGRPLDVFIELVLRHALCNLLLNHLFRRFHPEAKEDMEAPVRALYETIRTQEPQLNASKWRSVAFAGLDRQLSSSNASRDGTYAKTFAYIFENSVLNALVTATFGPVHASRFRISSKDHSALVNLGKSAYIWNRDVKSTFLLQDFHVMSYGDNDVYDPSKMQIHETYTVSSKSPIVATIGLGLQSSLTHGMQDAQKTVWQEKVTVVTEEYFGHCL